MEPGKIVRENRLLPVVPKKNQTDTEKLLSNIKRSVVRAEDLVCIAVSPEGLSGLFLDDSGRDYVLNSSDLKERLDYVNANYIKKNIPRYVDRRSTDVKFLPIIKKFLSSSSVRRRYADWRFEEGVLGDSDELQEELKKNKSYVSADGEFKFKVLELNSGVITVLDLSDKKKYKVEASDLELAKPKELNEEAKISVVEKAFKAKPIEDAVKKSLPLILNKIRGVSGYDDITDDIIEVSYNSTIAAFIKEVSSHLELYSDNLKVQGKTIELEDKNVTVVIKVSKGKGNTYEKGDISLALDIETIIK